ncbi:unnamed protein product [Leptosia nina]|uniref:Mediator of DNA damage checkpoint protein 1 n=1 Tax=Leptosia nina TaxID=320188 RepID=A0AAV1J1N3_9NEOP
MELTQRLECSQVLFNNPERLCPEQIGFLGICGTKYPVKRGPNKIGRDPQTCNIVLNLNSISRQHAVINVLNKNNFMLMDLDSANKTKLQNKSLDPYIPQPLRNGDTVQFGEVFGIFRLLEEETDLPMTQALDIPETPIVKKHISKINRTAMIPESPEVSDRDDSFIAPSQPKEAFKSPNNNYVKASGKSISIQPIGQTKIDNVYWNSSKKSDSFILNNSVISVKSSDVSGCNNVHDLETQIPNLNDNTSIYEAKTQLPQEERTNSPDFYNMETQVPVLNTTLSNKKDVIKEIHADEDKENNISIFEAETQEYLHDIKEPTNKFDGSESDITSHKSNDIILFNDIDSQPLDNDLESQVILPSSPCGLLHQVNITNTIKVNSNDCHDFDILPTQVIPSLDLITEDSNDIDMIPSQTISKMDIDNETDSEDCNPNQKAVDEDVTDCEEDLDFDKNNVELKASIPTCKSNPNFEEVETQIIPEVNQNNKVKTQVISENETNNIPEGCDFEDMLTQVIPTVEDSEKPLNITKKTPPQLKNRKPEEDVKKKVLNKISTLNNVFKVPTISPSKVKQKESPKSQIKKTPTVTDDNDSNYYCFTQDIINDLCSQKTAIANDDSLETEIKINESVAMYSSQKIRDIVGAQSTPNQKQFPSDSPDCESASENLKPFILDLPDSQEISSSRQKITPKRDQLSTENSSESETEADSTPGTPILFKKKLRKSNNIREDLLKKFESQGVPTRISTRVKKPTEKGNNMSILKSSLINSEEDSIDPDIIAENIMRLKEAISRKSTKRATAKKVDDKHDVKVEKEHTADIIKEERGSVKSKKKDDKSETSIVSEEKPSTLKETSKTKTGRKAKESKRQDKIKTEQITKSTKESKKPKIKIRISDPRPDNILKNGTVRQTRCRRKKDDSLQENDSKEENKRKANSRTLKRSLSNTDLSNISEKRKRTKRTETRQSSSDNEEQPEPRRSRRQRTKKELIEKLKEESTVFESPQCGIKKPVANKQLAYEDRPATALGLLTKPRAMPSRRQKPHRVLFTAYPYEDDKVLEALGAVVTSDVKECTVVLTMQIKRTFKLLCAVGLGKPIVGRQWVQACVDNNVIVDPWLYLIHDEATEKRFNFKLQQSLTGKKKFLKGINVSSTLNVMPHPKEMKMIVECSGATWKEPTLEPPKSNWVVVSSVTDEVVWPALKNKGAIIVSPEFVLAGVLRQTLEIEKHRIA